MKQITLLILAIILCLTQFMVHADDDSTQDHDRAKQLMESGDIVPLENILKTSRDTHPGKVLEVELETERDKLVYEIEILDTQGIVWELKYDAYTGKLLNTEKEN